jgi:hypothetical protein
MTEASNFHQYKTRVIEPEAMLASKANTNDVTTTANHLPLNSLTSEVSDMRRVAGEV